MAEIVVCPGCGVKNRVRLGMRGMPLCGKCQQPLVIPAATDTDTAEIRALTAENFESALRLNPSPLLIDFWAAWSQPCRRLAAALVPFLRRHPGIDMAKVDIDAEPGLASSCQIFTVPTLILFDKGREVHRVSDVLDEGELEAEFAPWLKGI